MSAAAYDVIVVGAGANGLVAAAWLGEADLRVLLLERDPDLGGRFRPIEFALGFRAAPLGLDPGYPPAPMVRAIGLEGLERDTADVGFTVAIEPGVFLTLPRDVARAAEAIRRHSPADAARWPAFTARLHALAGFLEALAQAPAPDVSASSLRELLPLLELGRRFRALGRHNMTELLRTLPLSVWELLDDWFECASLKAAVAAGGIQDHAQGPRSGGTGFVLLHHLIGAPAGSVRGRLPWRGGPAAFSRAAERAARRAGVSIRPGAGVDRIEVRDHAVAGVVLGDGEEIPARAVLSTTSPARTLLDWVDPVWLDPEFRHAVANVRHRGCTAIVMWALEALPDLPGAATDALGGLVSLTPTLSALEKAGDAAKYGEVSAHPHVECTIPTLRWPDLAAAGKHVMVARVQYAPYRLRDGAVWDATRTAALAESAAAAFEAVSPGFRSRIRHQVAWSPRDLEERYGFREGAPSQGELGLDQILFMRPVAGWEQHATPIEGLYLGGSGSHPGPGILGGAGWLAAQRLLGDRRRSEAR